MERSRSKRNYYYDHHDGGYDGGGDAATMMGGGGRSTRPRYNNNNNNHHFNSPNHRHHHRGGGGLGGFNPLNNNLNRPLSSKPQPQMQQLQQNQQQQDPSSLMVTTTYRILCHDMRAGGVIGKSGTIIKSIRQHTGAWINVHELIPGDEERIIEISDTRRRDPEGRMPSFSPAQEALFLIHDRMLESGGQGGGGFYNDEDGVGGGGSGGRVATRLVVNRMHVGCLLGKGGKIIEQMRIETKTQIRILPRDHTLPRCVSMSEEIVQVVGDINNVKNAIAIISSRLRESQHRDRSHFHGRIHSPERFFDDEYIPHMNNAGRRDGGNFGSRFGGPNYRGNNYGSRSSGFMVEAGPAPNVDNTDPFNSEDLVFRMLCPVDKVDTVFGESDGIVELLQNEIGVDVKLSDHMAGSNERIIIVSSEEGPDDELFPAQEALLHIQTRIVDLVPETDNVITTRLLIPSIDIGCLEGRDGSLSEMGKLTGANIQILPREEVPAFVSGNHELVQIVGEIKAAREALVEVTSRLRSHLYRELFQNDATPPSGSVGSVELGEASPLKTTPTSEPQTAVELPSASSQNLQTMPNLQPPKEPAKPSTDSVKQIETKRPDVPSSTNRLTVPLVTRSILEVEIPDFAAPMFTKNKLAQISEISGADVSLKENGPDGTQKIIQLSGTREQAERAQSMLQGIIISIQE